MIAIRSAVALGVGRAVGAIVCKHAKVFGGIMLIGIGAFILIKHLTGG